MNGHPDRRKTTRSDDHPGKGSSGQIPAWSEVFIRAYTNANRVGDVDGRKSTSGFMVTLSGGAIAWQSRLQKSVTLSTIEVECIATVEAGKELLWCKELLQGLGFKQHRYVLHCDSLSAINLIKNPTFHSRSKHIELRHH